MIDALHYTTLDSPLGRLLLTSDGQRLRGIYFPGHAQAPMSAARHSPRLFDAARRQLDAYFAGRLHEFDLPLAIEGRPFECRVWKALCEIGYGTTVSYGEIARRIGQPKACRAVGLANGRNPLPIVVPCHRVIGADGTLTGYGGGLDIKRFLLELEGATLPRKRQRSLSTVS